MVDDAVPAETLLDAVRACRQGLIREVALFDVYAAPGSAEGKKSLAVAVRLQAPGPHPDRGRDRGVAAKIVAAAEKATGAVLR